MELVMDVVGISTFSDGFSCRPKNTQPEGKHPSGVTGRDTLDQACLAEISFCGRVRQLAKLAKLKTRDLSTVRDNA